MNSLERDIGLLEKAYRDPKQFGGAVERLVSDVNASVSIKKSHISDLVEFLEAKHVVADKLLSWFVFENECGARGKALKLDKSDVDGVHVIYKSIRSASDMTKFLELR